MRSRGHLESNSVLLKWALLGGAVLCGELESQPQTVWFRPVCQGRSLTQGFRISGFTVTVKVGPRPAVPAGAGQ